MLPKSKNTESRGLNTDGFCIPVIAPPLVWNQDSPPDSPASSHRRSVVFFDLDDMTVSLYDKLQK
jgi:hypothetical protein